MTDYKAGSTVSRMLFIAAASVIVLWGVYQAQPVVVLMLVACFLAVIGTAPVLWLERKKVPTTFAVALVVFAMVAVLIGVAVIVGASLNSFYNALPFYKTRIHDLLSGFKTLMARNGLTVTDRILLGYLNPEAVLNMTAQLFTALGSALSNTLLILFTVLFILLEASTFPAKVRSVLDNPDADFLRVSRFADDIKRYMIIKTILNLAGGVLITVWLTILGVDYPVLWGFLAFLLHFIPNLGSVVAVVPAVLFAYIQRGGASAALTASGYLVIGMVLGNVIEPRIMGHKLGMSTLVIFLSLIFWGYLLGLVGALLCVPLTMTVKLASEANDETRWIGVLLGPAFIAQRSGAQKE